MTGSSRPKIICLSLPKTGTTTLARALRRAGLAVADWQIRPRQSRAPGIQGEFVGALMYRGYFGSGDPLAHLADFDAVCEMSVLRPGANFWPQMDFGLLSAIESRHPEAKFILSVRDPARTVESMKSWYNLGSKRLPRHPVPGLPEGYGAAPGELERWIEGHYAFCRRMFAGSHRFLEFGIEDPEAPAKIGSFIGRNLPWWGHSNSAAGRAANTGDAER